MPPRRTDTAAAAVPPPSSPPPSPSPRRRRRRAPHHRTFDTAAAGRTAIATAPFHHRTRSHRIAPPRGIAFAFGSIAFSFCCFAADCRRRSHCTTRLHFALSAGICHCCTAAVPPPFAFALHYSCRHFAPFAAAAAALLLSSIHFAIYSSIIAFAFAAAAAAADAVAGCICIAFDIICSCTAAAICAAALHLLLLPFAVFAAAPLHYYLLFIWLAAFFIAIVAAAAAAVCRHRHSRRHFCIAANQHRLHYFAAPPPAAILRHIIAFAAPFYCRCCRILPAGWPFIYLPPHWPLLLLTHCRSRCIAVALLAPPARIAGSRRLSFAAVHLLPLHRRCPPFAFIAFVLHQLLPLLPFILLLSAAAGTLPFAFAPPPLHQHCCTPRATAHSPSPLLHCIAPFAGICRPLYRRYRRHTHCTAAAAFAVICRRHCRHHAIAPHHTAAVCCWIYLLFAAAFTALFCCR